MLDHGLEFIRATEAAAIAASKWIGTGDKIAADKAATDEMIARLNQIDFAGVVRIGEGKKDKSFGLFNGDCVGGLASDEFAERYEIAVDPIEGTRPTVTSGPEALSVLAIAEEHALYSTEEFYMNKIAYGPAISSKVDLKLNDPIQRNVEIISEVTGKSFDHIVVCLLDRPRHEKMIAEFRSLGVRIKLIQDCDVSGAIATCMPDSGIDLLYGIGGSPEGVITACAMKCLRGGFKGQVCKADGTPTDFKVYAIDDMVRGKCLFVATGITNGSLLKGVRFTSRGPVTNSVVMRSESGTIRWMRTDHSDS